MALQTVGGYQRVAVLTRSMQRFTFRLCRECVTPFDSATQAIADF
nr:hypothetical protein [Dendronalium sp. ChiSLP03b]MDZ8206059.1 hypothetical protein [Dendronalium sp. ChiSLP03b]